jgi:hypothetical protein
MEQFHLATLLQYHDEAHHAKDNTQSMSYPKQKKKNLSILTPVGFKSEGG